MVLKQKPMSYPMSHHLMDVFIRGERDYIQGTQMVARASDWLRSNISQPDTAVLKQCQFTEITKNKILLVPLEVVKQTPDLNARMVGRAQWLPDQNIETAPLDFAFVYAKEQAPAYDKQMNLSHQLTSGPKPLDAEVKFSHVCGVEDALNLFVQSIKQCHSNISADVIDVWWTGMRGGNFPLIWPSEWTAGQLSLTQQRINGKDRSYQSMTRAKFMFSQSTLEWGKSLEFSVSFAFKSEAM